MSIIVTIRLDTLKDLATLPDGVELVSVKQDGGGGGTRWPADTQVSVAYPTTPYQGVYQTEIEWFLEKCSGDTMTYGHVSKLIRGKFPDSPKISQIRATLKNRKLLERV